MALTFLTPLAALAALAALLPLAVALRRERRARAVRAQLGLEPPPRRGRLTLLGAIVAVPALAGLATAQPVLDFREERRQRTDAEAYVVIDTSRSMLAASGPDSATRFERARALAAALRDGLPEVPLGLVSLTDRALPHLFPTSDRAVFAAALEVSLGVEQPPPRDFFTERATDLGALAAVLRRGYFSPEATTRLLVVLTDGETRQFPEGLGTLAERSPSTEVVVVPLWERGERVFVGGVAETAYEADPAGPAALERLAEGSPVVRLVAETSPGTLVDAARESVGAGPTSVVALEGRELALMPYVTALALLPLGLVLWRRNL